MLLNSEFTASYLLKRLVFINSASHGYSEIMLDDHLAMFGNNNRGKTASLAAIKLLLYPEDNFNHCENKFNFTSKSGKQYNKFESYDYYFPTATSFLLLEVINPMGAFCMALYRAGDFKYHRIFIPKPYDELRHLFWDDIEGDFSAHLGIDSLKQAVKQLNGRHITHKNELEKIMYANYANMDSEFCIVPLKDNQSSSIRAFTSIFELAFNSGKGEEKALPEAIATIIEMQRSREEEKLETNFDELQRQYSELYEQGEHLQRLSNQRDHYSKLSETFEGLVEKQRHYSLGYSVLLHKLNSEREAYEGNILDINQKISKQEVPLNELKAQRKKKKDELSILSGSLIEIEKIISQYQEHKIRVEQYLSDHELDLKSAESIITESIVSLEEQLTSIQDIEKAQQSLKSRQLQRHSKQKEIERLQESLDNLSRTLVAQVSQDSASILTTLNPIFFKITTDISSEEKEVLERFSSLFHQDAGCLTFKTQNLGLKYQAFSAEQQLQELEKQKYEAKNDLIQLDQHINNLLKIIHNSGDKTLTSIKQQDIEQTLAQYQSLCKEITGYSFVCEALSKYQNELSDLATKKDALEQSLDVELETLKALSGELESLFEQKRLLERSSEGFINIAQALHRANQSVTAVYMSEQDDHFQQMLQKIDLNRDNAENIRDQANDLKLNMQGFMSNFERFIQETPIKDVDPYVTRHKLEECGTVLLHYRNLFGTLNHLKAVLNQQIQEHNHYLNNMIQEIENASKILTGTIQSMNQTLANQPVSNFAEVRLKLKPRADFETLLDNCRKHDISENSLMESSFYEMLLSYVQKHFNKRNRRIQMVDLIDSINYEYLDYDNKIETKAQSGGTTSTVTSLIISILLKKILMADHTLRMPIVIDEVADIDASNMKNIVAQITQSGFSIFCATPTFSPIVCKHIGNYIHIDSSQLKVERHVAKCALHIMPMHINRFGIMPHEN